MRKNELRRFANNPNFKSKRKAKQDATVVSL